MFYTLWIHFVYFIIVCVEKCILHRERKEICKIRVPVRKIGKEREEERKEERGGDGKRKREREGERERERREKGGVSGGEGGFWTCFSAMAI